MKKLLSGMAICLTATQTYAVVPVEAQRFDTNVKTYSMTSTQRAKIQSAERKIIKVIGSEEFRSRILNHKYGGRLSFNNSNGLTNSQIYTKIIQAAEKYKLIKNNTMDLNIKTYYQNSNVVGYTTTTSIYINMNTKYLNKYTANEVATNMTHEWLHKLGFGHAVNYSTSRDYSVPYAVGKIMGELARKY